MDYCNKKPIVFKQDKEKIYRQEYQHSDYYDDIEEIIIIILKSRRIMSMIKTVVWDVVTAVWYYNIRWNSIASLTIV